MKFPLVPTDPGVTRQVVAESPDMMVVLVRFDSGAKGKLHNHPHLQATYVEAGHFTFLVDGQVHNLGPGDGLVIPSEAMHSCRCDQAGTLIDTFTPRRDDLL
jgi:quercetin dioxygenase-like cupin family protein